MRSLLGPALGALLCTTVGLLPAATSAAADPPAEVVLAGSDAFSRAVAPGWGAAVAGGTWAPSEASAFSVSSGVGRVLHTSGGRRLSAELAGSDVSDTLTTAAFSVDDPPAGWGQVLGVVARRQLDGQAYEGRLRLSAGGTAYLGFVRRDAGGREVAVGGETAVPLPAGQQAAVAAGGAWLRLAVEVSGAAPTTLRSRAWLSGTPEPTGWTAQATDSTRVLGGFGSVGVSTQTWSGTPALPVAFSLDSLTVQDLSPGVGPVRPDLPAQRYGALPLGTARYPVPASARWVAPTGSDEGAGTLADPWRTIQHAVAASPTGTTISLRRGTYRESVVVYGKRLTIQNAPGELVRLTGSDPVAGWRPDGSAYAVDGWAPALRRGARPDLVDPAHPLAASPDMVFLDGRPQEQVAERSAVRPGTFFVDLAARRLVLGSDPAGHAVEASTRSRGLYLNRAHGSVVRGIAVKHYANHPDELGALFADSDDVLVENVVVAHNAGVGVTVIGRNGRVLHSTVRDNGQIGLHAHRADGLQVRANLLQHNNTEHFSLTGAEGNSKITTSTDVVVADNLVRWSEGRGLWFDESAYRVTAVRNVIYQNADRGLQFEISGQGVLADNLIAGNGADGIAVIGGSDVEIFHNSFWNNTRAVFLVTDERRRSDTVMPHALRDVSLRNNVASDARPGASQLLAVEDTTRSRSASQMGVTADHDAWAQVTGHAAAWWAGWADYPRPYLVFPSFPALQRGTGQEARGVGVTSATEPFYADAAGGDFRLRADGPAAALRGAPLPASVAAALGVPAGTVRPVGSSLTSTATR